jgi:serine/threonine protein kinase
MKPILKKCCLPAFLIATAGPWLCILGAVFADHVIVQQLTDFIWIGGDPYDDKRLVRTTRILASLGKGIDELKEFYSELSRRGPQEDPQRFYPFVRQYSVGEHVVRFSYEAYLIGKSPESHSKAIFLAKTEAEDEVSRQKIIVKFVQTYNAEAHRILATADRAPKLLYCSTEDPNPTDLAGLIMVVMQYVDGKTAHQRYGNQQLPQPIFDQVEDAIGILHAKNIVFGDLRPPNVMITEDDRVLLVDFDWCGVHQEHTYPVTLNDGHNTPNSIDWHPGVVRGGRMMKEHDTYRLQSMKPQSATVHIVV